MSLLFGVSFEQQTARANERTSATASAGPRWAANCGDESFCHRQSRKAQGVLLISTRFLEGVAQGLLRPLAVAGSRCIRGVCRKSATSMP
jgi:hypothetical protein